MKNNKPFELSCAKKEHHSERLQVNQTHIRRFCVFKKSLYYLSRTSWPTKWIILLLVFLNGKLTLKLDLKSAVLFLASVEDSGKSCSEKLECIQKNNVSARSCHRTTVFTKKSWKSLDLYKVIWLSQTVIKL